MNNKYEKLKKKIQKEYHSIGEFADYIGVSRQTLTNKLSGRRSFSADDIEAWCFHLDISLDELTDYFFPTGIEYKAPRKGRYA